MVRREVPDCGLTSKLVRNLLMNKFVVIIGDSIQRGIYKDLVSLLQRDAVLSERDLRAKGEMTFMNDTLVEGGVKGQLNNGTSYTEVRQYQSNIHLLRFYFVTRCYNPYVESVMRDLEEGPAPDLVIMNSCLWDMTRYGMTAITEYKQNLGLLFSRLSKTLPPHCLMVWNSTMPISRAARGGFLVEEVQHHSHTLRMDVLEANFFASKLVVHHGFDVLDLHFRFRHMLHWRAQDGIHWCSTAHRRISELLLVHVSNAWGMSMPPIHFPPQHGHPAPRPQQPPIPPQLRAVADRLTEDHHRHGGQPRRGGVLPAPAFRRPGPYALLQHPGPPRPSPQWHARGAVSYHSENHSKPFPPVQCRPLQQQDFRCYSTPHFSVPHDVCEGGKFGDRWTPYHEDSFSGAHRHAGRAGRSRYAQY